MEERSINVLPVIGAGIHTGIPLYQKQKIDYIREQALKQLKRENKVSMELMPDLLSHIAWHYADKVLSYCAVNKLTEVAELSRATKEYKQKYRAMLIDKVGISHARNNWNAMDEMINEMSQELSILWYTVNGELKKHYPDIAHDTMCTDAIISMLIIEELKKHISDLRKLIHRNGINTEVYMSKFMTNLYDIMDAYRQDCIFDRTELIDRGLLIIINRIKNAQFEQL